ncbi:MAG: SPOR domain-containing protein, partial [Flavobacteriales bacterium]
THRVTASIDDSNNTFYPPKKAVSFNEQIQKNDGLLAHYISDVEKIPFETAIQKIQTRVKGLKENLAQGKTISFPNIGDLEFNNEGKIQFEPIYNLNYLTDAFGLSQFVSPAIDREVYKEEVEQLEKVIPIAITHEKRKSRPYFKYAAVALIALTAGGFATSNYYISKIEAYNQIAQEEAEQQLDAKIQEATFNLNSLPAITLNVTKQSGNYHVVAGAFRVEENSDKKIEELKALGYNARKIGINEHGLHEVVYGSYEDRMEALNELRTIKKTHNQDAWLKADKTQPANDINKRNSTAKTINSLSEPVEVTSTQNAISKNDSKFLQSPNIIQIMKNVKGVESGFYLVYNSYKDTTERNKFIKTLESNGHSNINFFSDSENLCYYIYTEKFNDLASATKSMNLKTKSAHNEEMFIVKVEN